MALRRRAPRLPDEARRSLDLRRGEKILATAPLSDGWAVVTTQHLQVLAGPGLRRAWCDVDGARLDADAAELTVTWVDGSPATVLHLEAEHARPLVRAVHERVQSSVVHTARVTVPGGAVVRVALRRDADGGLLTQVLGNGRVNLSDPATAAVVDAAEAKVREAAGLS
ncbi:hypothetical protein [Actinotalea sp. JY-7885]|uniref:hypothetical protein n=1 Tax=Actinotalea sp. JY-7885 TaxID=2758576 RepID=UPI00165E0440|nr:hypothetical protein [Actinotalea sp. JY-7885]